MIGELEQQKREHKNVLFYLGKYGAPVGNAPTSPTQELSFEEVVARALSFSRMNPTIARTLPVFIAKNEKHFTRFQTLKELVKKEHQENTLGFFLDLTCELTGNRFFRNLAVQLKKNEKIEDFFVTSRKGKYRERLLKKNTPLVAKRWFFRMNMTLESFKSTFEKFVS